MSTVLDRLTSLQQRAERGPIGKKRSSFELYRLLQDCMILAVDCLHDPDEERALRDLLNEGRTGRSRKGVLATSTPYLLVCRFVFRHGCSESANRNNASRYGLCLEQAAERGIDPLALADWLTENGGVNALFLARPVAAKEITTKALRLNTPITIPKHGTVTLQIRRDHKGAFDIVREPPMNKTTTQKAIDALHAAYGLLADAKLEGDDLAQLPAVERQIVAAIHDLRASLLVGRGGLIAFPGGKGSSGHGSGNREISQA